jgi:hypothetical protein
MDLSKETKETKETLDLHDIGSELMNGFGRQCLLARCFAEAGVRFIELRHSTWDQNTGLYDGMTQNAASSDQLIAYPAHGFGGQPSAKLADRCKPRWAPVEKIGKLFATVKFYSSSQVR